MEKTLLSIIPVLLLLNEVFVTDGYRQIKHGRRNKHALTFGIWCVLVAISSGFNRLAVDPLQMALLCLGVRFAFFNFVYNKYILKISPWHLGNNFTDRIEKCFSIFWRVALRVIALIGSILNYII